MSRRPFSDREKQYIRTHASTMSRGMIAQELGKQFPEDNGGYRSWRSVKSFIRKEQESMDRILKIKIPGSLIVSARESGFSIQDISEVALKAILDEFETLH